MHSFKALLEKFEQRFHQRIFPDAPASLYDPTRYILTLGGKRVRPVLCLMGNELFDELHERAYYVAGAIELFHNFTLIHDDIMDQAPLRRGKPTVHQQYDEDSALLAGDVMLVYAYDQLNRVGERHLSPLMQVFNRVAREVCEGQQLDMDYAALSLDEVNMDAYLHMITLKTSVLLAGSLKMGGILGGGSEGNLEHLYAFGKNLGIAFQIHDDYLDAFGDPAKFGKQVGGDILANKKTFLLLKAWELGNNVQHNEIRRLLQNHDDNKVEKMLNIYYACKADQWAKEEKERYIAEAKNHLDKITVLSSRKKELEDLIGLLLDREN
jgi:geranylgeranyl diphosphate synthase type II